MKRLVVVADDFGLCRAVNDGIVEAHLRGIVTELSLMLGSPGTQHALELVNKHGIQNVGIHMLLKNWRDSGSLVHRPDYTALFEHATAQEIATMVERELAEFEEVVGHKPTHITSQYGILAHPNALPTVTAYAAHHNVPMRQPRSVDDSDLRDPNSPNLRYIITHGVRTTDDFLAHIEDVQTPEAARSAFEQDLATLPDGASAEMCLHPGHVDDELRALTSLVEGRARDLDLATDPEFKAWLDANGITAVPYSQI